MYYINNHAYFVPLDTFYIYSNIVYPNSGKTYYHTLLVKIRADNTKEEKITYHMRPVGLSISNYA